MSLEMYTVVHNEDVFNKTMDWFEDNGYHTNGIDWDMLSHYLRGDNIPVLFYNKNITTSGHRRITYGNVDYAERCKHPRCDIHINIVPDELFEF